MDTHQQNIGGFRLLGSLEGGGDGRQGTVFRAECIQPTVPGVAVGEVVALKTMKNEDETGAAFDKLSKRVATLASLNHPNVLRYRGCFNIAGPFSSLDVVVMDLLEGETLANRLAANPAGLDADEALRIVDGALDGLDCALKAGIIHRDVKPGNIFICRDGTVKMIDFELGRAVAATGTASGSFVGTFNYMAPEFKEEKFRGDGVSDVFSMGVVLHEVLTGALPYAQDRTKGEQADFAFLSRWKQRAEGLCVIHVKSAIGRLLQNATAVVSKALAENREARFKTAGEFRQALSSVRIKELNNGAGNKYQLLRLIGRGGFGEVFKARDSSGRLVAVKRLLNEHYGARFVKEARIMRKLDNPAFVRFIDYFEVRAIGQTEAYLVMDFLPGMPGLSLRDAIKRGASAPLVRKDVLCAFLLYARGLAFMHERGIYHRDIKPSNLYYPAGDVSRSAIMDLGIARDVNGSVTTDQVPGTLDYMPCEVALGTSRGDAAMDVYALGLCLYEALTLKTAYPRLPAGRTGVEMFLQRARSRIAPNISDPFLDANPKLLRLVQDMTNVDASRRIRSASEVVRRLEGILAAPLNFQTSDFDGNTATVVTATGEARTPRPELVARSKRTEGAVRNKEPRQTPLANPAHSAARRNVAVRTGTQGSSARSHWNDVRVREMLGLVGKGVAAAVIIGAVIVGFVFAWNSGKHRWNVFVESRAKQREQEERQAYEERERLRIESKCADAREEAVSAAKMYLDDSVAVVSADLATDEWRLKWRGDNEIADVYAESTNSFFIARLQRIERDNEREEARRRAAEARAAEQKAQEAERAKREKELAERKAEDERRRAEIAKALVDAAREADGIIAAFADEGCRPAKATADSARWQSRWGRFSTEPEFRSLSARIAEARAARDMFESGKAVAAECDRWLQNIETVSSFDVKNWRGNITRASIELKKALNHNPPLISEELAGDVRKRIDECSKWIVGVIDNKTYRMVRFGGREIAPMASGTVVFKTGFPAGAAITSDGCAPVRVMKERFDSNVFTLLPRTLVEIKSGVCAKVPQFGNGIICLVDGVEAKPGEMVISPVKMHHVVYRNVAETYPGVRDYKDQDIVFTVDGTAKVDVPAPDPTWQQSRDFAEAERSARAEGKGRRIVSEVEKLLSPEPVTQRRSRLEKVHRILSNWEAPSALAALGAGVEADLRAKYEAERRRIRGLVKNGAPVAATITTDAGAVSIPAASTAMVTFEREWKGEAYAVLQNYEFVFLPREAADFDGCTFYIDPEKLVPVPVAISVPPLDSGVECMVGGKRVDGDFMIRPGEYECVYSRPDCVTQKTVFTVKVGEARQLPSPTAWEPSGAMSRLTEAISSFNDGAIGAAKAIAAEVGTIEDPARRKELEDLRKAIELREKLSQIQ